MQAQLWTMAAAATALAGVAALADRRRNRRADPDKVGFMPWPLILIFAILAAAICAALALGR